MSAGARFSIRHRPPATHWPTAEEAARARWFSPARIGALAVAERTWVPAMVPWRATEDGVVTPEVLEWYARFADGQPGVLVVEATGIRDVASGPLLRIGDDRFLPGLRRLVDTVRRHSGGRTRLFIQAIDFLAVRRRPEPAKYFGRFLDVDAGLRGRMADAAFDAGWLDAPEEAIRAHLLDSLVDDREFVEAVLTSSQLEALDFGYRERVGGRASAVDPRSAAHAARPLRRGRPPGARGRLRRDRAALRSRLHHGVLPVAPEHARRWLRRRARAPGSPAARRSGCGPRSRSAPSTWSVSASSVTTS